MKIRHQPGVKEMYFRDEFFVTDSTRRLKEDIEQLEADIVKMRRANTPRQEIDAYIDDKLFQIKGQFFTDNQVRALAAKAELEKIGQQWTKKYMGDPNAVLLERQRLAFRYHRATNDELIEAATSYTTGEGEVLAVLPDKLECLLAELEKRDGEGIEIARDNFENAMRANRYTEPWIHTPAGDKVLEELEAHDTEFGQVNVSAIGHSLTPIDIDVLVNEEAK